MLNGNVVIETQFFDGDLLVSTSKVDKSLWTSVNNFIIVSGPSVLRLVRIVENTYRLKGPESVTIGNILCSVL